METDECAGADGEDALVAGPAEAARLTVVETVQDRIVARRCAGTQRARAARIAHCIRRQSTLLRIPAEEAAGEEQLIASRRADHARRLDHSTLPSLIVFDQLDRGSDQRQAVGAQRLPP